MIIRVGKLWILIANCVSFIFYHMHSVQQPSNIPEPTYELVTKKPDNDDDVNIEKNPAYSVQYTSMIHHYDFVSETNQTKAKQ